MPCMYPRYGISTRFVMAAGRETLPTRSEAMIHIAMAGLMARRLTGENTISWRDPAPQTKHQIPGWNNGRKRPLKPSAT